MTLRTIAITGGLGLGVAVAAVLQAPGVGQRPPSPPPQESTAPAGVFAEGRVVAYPGAEIHVGAERSGRLVRVLADEGRVVRRGELLAEIESDELRATLDEARARLAEAEAELRLAELNLKRWQDLTEQQIATGRDLDQAQRDLDTARARRETARAAIGRYEAQLRKTRITAPIGGTVVAREADSGEMIAAGDRVMTLADLDRLRIEGEVHEADAGAVVDGAPVQIRADGYPGRTWKGRIEEVPDSVTRRRLKPQDPSRPTDARVLAVKVSLAEPTPLKLGTTVELRIEPSSE
jgi:RND family efflux transporter MFP subunit